MRSLRNVISTDTCIDKGGLDLLIEGMGRVFQRYPLLILSTDGSNHTDNEEENIFQIILKKF